MDNSGGNRLTFQTDLSDIMCLWINFLEKLDWESYINKQPISSYKLMTTFLLKECFLSDKIYKMMHGNRLTNLQPCPVGQLDINKISLKYK